MGVAADDRDLAFSEHDGDFLCCGWWSAPPPEGRGEVLQEFVLAEVDGCMVGGGVGPTARPARGTLTAGRPIGQLPMAARRGATGWREARREVETELHLLKKGAHSDSVARRRGAPPGLWQDRPLAAGEPTGSWKGDRVDDGEAIATAFGFGVALVASASR